MQCNSDLTQFRVGGDIGDIGDLLNSLSGEKAPGTRTLTATHPGSGGYGKSCAVAGMGLGVNEAYMATGDEDVSTVKWGGCYVCLRLCVLQRSSLLSLCAWLTPPRPRPHIHLLAQLQYFDSSAALAAKSALVLGMQEHLRALARKNWAYSRCPLGWAVTNGLVDLTRALLAGASFTLDVASGFYPGISPPGVTPGVLPRLACLCSVPPPLGTYSGTYSGTCSVRPIVCVCVCFSRTHVPCPPTHTPAVGD